MPERIKRINELIREEFSQIISEELEPPKGTLITITRVETAKDLSQAQVWLSVFPPQAIKNVQNLIQDKLKELNLSLGQKISLKKTPKITIKFDLTEEKAAQVEKILDYLKNKR